jgi:drug/metabolite transporter (DMT)-like permease
MSQKAKVLPLAVLAFGVLSISWSAIFVRWAQMPGIASAFYRLLIASAVVWIILLTQKSQQRAVTRKMLLLASLGGMFFAADVGSYNVAVLNTTAGGATFLGNNAPLVVGLLTWLLTRKLPPRPFWTALLLGSAGAWLIVYVDRVDLPIRSYGDLLACLASVCFALYLVVTERVREQMSTLTLVALSTTASALALFLFAISTKTSLSIPSGSALASLVGLGLVCQLSGYYCLTYALGHLPATITSVFLLAVAPLTAIWAFFFFNERMTLLQWFGGGLILAAVWVVSKQPMSVGRSNVLCEAGQMSIQPGSTEHSGTCR